MAASVSAETCAAATASSVGERHLLLAAVLADQADDGLGGAEALEGEQALVDVADLLHGQRAERDRAQLPADRDGLDRAEHVQDGPVVHGERQPRVGVRVEQRAVVGDELELGVGHAPVDDGEQGQQPVPGQDGVLELALVAAGVGDPLLELGVQAARRVGAGVQLVVGGEQAAFLGEQQEDDPHHHRDRAPVDLVGGDIGADAGPAERGDQQLDRLADLDAQPVGDLFLVVQALPQQRRELAFRRDGEEAAALEQGKEGTHHRSVRTDSGQEIASKTATVVTPPAGAHTRAHHRPSVASPSSTPWWRQSWASRSAGVAGQSEPLIRATGESSLTRPSSRTSPVPGSIRRERRR